MGVESDGGDGKVDMVNQPVGSGMSTDGPEESVPCRLSEADVRKSVEETVDRKLSPVMDMLIDIRDEMAVGLDDVVAGIGYIFGLTGLMALIYSRRKG